VTFVTTVDELIAEVEFAALWERNLLRGPDGRPDLERDWWLERYRRWPKMIAAMLLAGEHLVDDDE
jgi:hypothetical protein